VQTQAHEIDFGAIFFFTWFSKLLRGSFLRAFLRVFAG